jgi:hypothetical protein
MDINLSSTTTTIFNTQRPVYRSALIATKYMGEEL